MTPCPHSTHPVEASPDPVLELFKGVEVEIIEYNGHTVYGFHVGSRDRGLPHVGYEYQRDDYLE
jgi:hypothetical protein